MKKYRARFYLQADESDSSVINLCGIYFESDCSEYDAYKLGEKIVKSIPGASYNYSEEVPE